MQYALFHVICSLHGSFADLPLVYHALRMDAMFYCHFSLISCIQFFLMKQDESHPAWTPTVTSISEWTPQVIKGDVNADGAFNITDAVLLQKWLLTVPDMNPADWKATDFNNDNQLDARDLSMMKRGLIK
ncbi:MAG: dockerin type I repeat-containing protein [Oscillospiraceae bacterium]|nr:dockerin type I repeat-containing protein [Oscillospiraceae bacterium]